MRVQFYISALYELEHYLGLAELLDANRFHISFAADERILGARGSSQFDLKKINKILNSFGYELFNVDESSDIAITTRPTMALYRYDNIKLLLKYGVGLVKDIPIKRMISNKLFDGYLVHGNYEKNIFKEIGIEESCIYTVGLPKLIIEKKLESYFKKRHNDTINLLYMSTWLGLGGFETIVQNLAKFNSHISVVIKTHHHQEERMESLFNTRIITGGPLFQNYTLFQNANIVVVDARSGVAPESLHYKNKKIIYFIPGIENKVFFQNFIFSIAKVCYSFEEIQDEILNYNPSDYIDKPYSPWLNFFYSDNYLAYDQNDYKKKKKDLSRYLMSIEKKSYNFRILKMPLFLILYLRRRFKFNLFIKR
jgi:hypothetical protein